MLRGLGLAAVMVIVRLLQGAMINAWQEWAAWISVVLLLLFIICAAVWGAIDGRADATATRDPDRRKDLAMTWLLAGLVAGIVSGAICWVIGVFYKGLYTGGLINEVTTFAAFTALVAFLSGIVGVTFGRWRVDRRYEKQPQRHHGLAAKEREGDTDVFAAARGDETPTGEIATARTEQRTAPVATAEREPPTERISTTDDDARTEEIRTDRRHGRPDAERE